MQKNVLLVLWLAIASFFTISMLSACSDDDTNENQNGGGVTINGVDQAEYFRQNIGMFSTNDSIVCPLMMTAVDELTPTVFSYFLDDDEDAEELFLSWIHEQAQRSLVRDGSTIVYTPYDAHGAPQGTITFRKALPSETATIAVVEFKDVNKMLGIDKIKFQPKSAWPENGGCVPFDVPEFFIREGKGWFWGDVPKTEVFWCYDNFYTYYYTYPKLITFNEYLVKTQFSGYYKMDGFTACEKGWSLDPGFREELINDGFGKNGIIVHGLNPYGPQIMTGHFDNGTFEVSSSKCVEWWTINDKNTQVWICRGYRYARRR